VPAATVAVVQTGPVPFDSHATARKVAGLIAAAAERGAELAVFPEATLGTYPKGLAFGAPLGRRTEAGRDEYAQYHRASVTLAGEEIAVVAEAAAAHGVFVVIGIIERVGATLYCTSARISPEDGVVGHHRKLMPTGAERLVWGFGDGSTLPVHETGFGRLGSVICWENYMPLLRQAMYAKGVEIWCAPTVDDRDSWQSTMQHIALEGRCFVLGSCQAVRADAFGEDYASALEPDEAGYLIRGGSVIVSPGGEVLAGPVYDREAILVAEIDVSERARYTYDFDPTGHYSRPDVFSLTVDERPKPSVRFES
jgi:nitrilase